MSGKSSLNYIFIFVLIHGFAAFGQARLSGRVSSEAGAGVPGVSVVLKNDHGKIIAFRISESNGEYNFEAVPPGNKTLEVSALGFEKQELAIPVTASDKILQKDVTLKEKIETLDEVVIAAPSPVTRKGDTLIYDAKALQAGRPSVVEDMLKNIPGVTVGSDGSIRYGNTPIEKVMIDGDDLFNKGYPVITQNMPAEPIDKVEILFNYSKNKLLKGVEDSNGIALNLTVGEKFKDIWFGNAMAAYGIQSRYKAQANLMNFRKQNKSFANIAANNAGYQSFSSIAESAGSSDIETIGNANGAVQIMSIGSRVTVISEERARFNNTKTATLGTILPLFKKGRIRLNSFLNADNLESFQDAVVVRSFDGTSFTNTETNNFRTRFRSGYLSSYINYDFSESQMLQSLSIYNTGSKGAVNNLVFNGSVTNERLKSDNQYFDQQVTYSQKGNNNTIMLIKGRFRAEWRPQEYAIDDYLLGDLFNVPNIQSIENNGQSTQHYMGLQADIRKKHSSGNLLELSIGIDNNYDTLASRFLLYTAESAIAPDGFQAMSTLNVTDIYSVASYNIKFGKASVGARVGAHNLHNRFHNYQNSTEAQSLFLVNPSLAFKYEINPENVVNAGYNYNITNSGLLQVNDTYLLTSSRSFSRGLGYFNQFENSGANLGYAVKHYLNRYSMSFGLNYSRQNNVVSYQSNLTPSSSLSDAFVIRGGERLGANFTSHFVVRRLKGSAAFDAQASKLTYYNRVNDSGLRKNVVYSQSYAFRWRSSFKSALNFSISSEWDFSTVLSDYTFKNSTKSNTLDLSYAVNKEINVKATAAHYNFGGIDRHSDYFFSDLEAAYSPGKRFTFGLTGRNLFNTNTFKIYNVSDIGYSISSYRLLPRYILLSIAFKF